MAKGSESILIAPDAKGRFVLTGVSRSDVSRVDITDVDLVLTTKGGAHYLLPGAGIAAMSDHPPEVVFSNGEVSADQLMSEVGTVLNLAVEVPMPSSLKLEGAQEGGEAKDNAHVQQKEVKEEQQQQQSQSTVSTLSVNTEASVEQLVSNAQKIDENLHKSDYDYVPPHQYEPPPAPVASPPGVPPPISLTPIVTLFMGNVVGTTSDTTSNAGYTTFYGGGGEVGSGAAAQFGPRNAAQFSAATIDATGVSGNVIVYTEGPLMGNTNPAVDHTTYYTKEFILNVAGYFTTLDNVTISGVPAGVTIVGATSVGGGVWTLPAATVIQQNSFTMIYNTNATGSFDMQFDVTGTTTRHLTFHSTQIIRFQYTNVTDASEVTNPGLLWDSNGITKEIYILPTQDQPNIITAGNGNNIIYGSRSNDTTTLGNGNNTVLDGNGNNTITVGNGNNTISAGIGSNTVNLGNGVNGVTLGNSSTSKAGASDVINVNSSSGSTARNTLALYAAGNNTVSHSNATTGDGDYTITMGNVTGLNTVNIGASQQTGNGTTTFATTITAGNGNASVATGDGTHRIEIGAASTSSSITTGAGNNTFVINSSANNTSAYAVTAGAGNNVITTTNGISSGTPGDGNYTISLGNGTSSITLGNGNTAGSNGFDTTITTGTGQSTIVAGSGTHNITVGNGATSIQVGAGNNTIVATAGGGGTIAATGVGSNTISTGAGGYGITVAGGGGTISTGVGGSTNNDSITINNSSRGTTDRYTLSMLGTGSNSIIGYGGEYLITLGTASASHTNTVNIGNSTSTQNGVTSFDTTIIGGDGASSITVGAGLHKIALGNGATTISVAGDNNNVVTTTGGSGAITFTGNGNNVFTTTGTGNYTISATGSGSNAITLVSGTSNTNGITVGSGANVVSLNDGTNTVTAGNGNNVITGSSNNANVNNIILGNGANTVTLGNGTNNVTAGNGNNSVTISNNSASTSTVVLGNGNDTVVLGAGTNTLTVGSGNNTITAGNGTNSFTVNGAVSSIDNITTGTGANTFVLTLGTINLGVGTGSNNTVDLRNVSNSATSNQNYTYMSSGSVEVYNGTTGLDDLLLTMTGGRITTLWTNNLYNYVSGNTAGNTSIVYYGTALTAATYGHSYFFSGGGTDYVYVPVDTAAAATSGIQFFGSSGSEYFYGGGGNNYVSIGNASGASVVKSINGGTGNNYFIVGSAGNIAFNGTYDWSTGLTNALASKPSNFLSINSTTNTRNTTVSIARSSAGGDPFAGISAGAIPSSVHTSYVSNIERITFSVDTQLNEVDYASSTTAVNVNLMTGVGTGGYAQGNTYAFTSANYSTINEVRGGNASGNVLTPSYANTVLIGFNGSTTFNDTNTLSTQHNILAGGAGTNIFNMGPSQSVIIARANATNIVDYSSSPAGVVVNLSSSQHTYAASTPIVVEAYSGTNWGANAAGSANSWATGDFFIPVNTGANGTIADNPNITTLYGATSYSNIIYGGSGSLAYIAGNAGDIVYGGTGQVDLTGGAGNDTFTGGTGGSFFRMSAGTDTAVTGGGTNIFYTAYNNSSVILNKALDNGSHQSVDSGFATGGYQSFAYGSDGSATPVGHPVTYMTGYENIVGTGGLNHYIVGDNNGNQINAGAGTNTIIIGSGTNIITAIQGSNTISLGSGVSAGTNTLNFETFNDSLSGILGSYSGSGANTSTEVFLNHATPSTFFNSGAGGDVAAFYGGTTNLSSEIRTGTSSYSFSDVQDNIISVINGSNYSSGATNSSASSTFTYDNVYSGATTIYGHDGNNVFLDNLGTNPETFYGGVRSNVYYADATQIANLTIGLNGGITTAAPVGGDNVLRVEGWGSSGAGFGATDYFSGASGGHLTGLNVLDVRSGSDSVSGTITLGANTTYNSANPTFNLSAQDIQALNGNTFASTLTLKLDNGDIFAPTAGSSTSLSGPSITNNSGTLDTTIYFYSSGVHNSSTLIATLNLHFGA